MRLKYKFLVGIITILGLSALFIYGNTVIYNIVAALVFAVLMIRTYLFNKHRKFKSRFTGIYMILIYFILACIQYAYFAVIIGSYSINDFYYFLTRWVGISLLVLSFLFERVPLIKEYVTYSLPSAASKESLRFSDFKNLKNNFTDLRDSLGFSKMQEIALDMPRHSSIKYVNDGNLSDSYFDVAYENLKDPYIYLVISNTGSAASDIISVFTQKQYNHASIAFDYDLETIISYNGGEKVYPPGLNQEMVEFFNKKDDASIIVYRLKATEEQKRKMIDRIKTINEEGSAYNMLGLMFKYSHKPNIMFCSQFVYKMLKEAGLSYFDKAEMSVKPTDLVELDYHRKLEYCYEFFFNKEKS